MEYQFFAILLLLVGFVLIVAEVFLPSGGMILILCAISFLASFWCATKAWYGSHPFAYGLYLSSLVVLIPTVIVGAFQVFPRTKFGRNLIAAPTLEEVTPYAEERARLSQYVGQIGRTLTPLTPGGLVTIEGERLHAFSEGVLIDRDQPVEIVAVRGTRVLVREAPAERGDKDPRAGQNRIDLARNDEAAPDAPLDFTFPQD